MWPPTISESHTEQLASYRWPQNKSNAIKENIMQHESMSRLQMLSSFDLFSI